MDSLLQPWLPGSRKPGSQTVFSSDPPVNLVPPSIDNMTPRQGDTLNGTVGTWRGTPTGYSLTWFAGGMPAATGSSYAIQIGNIGEVISLRIVATNANGDSSPASSGSTAAVLPLPPVNTVPPSLSISGSSFVFAPVSSDAMGCDAGSWDNSPTSFTYQWYANGILLPDQTGGAVGLATHVGDTLHCVVTASNAGGSTSATSNESGTVSQ